MADLQDIIDTLIAEAYGEGPEGMRRVGETILNRGAIRGLDPLEVVRQPNQYTGLFAPGPEAVKAQQDPVARAAAEAAWQLARQPGDPTGGADHYYNPNVVNPGWQRSMQHTGDYGGHTFYSSRQVPAEALAALLMPETRNVPSPRPRPASPMDQIAQLFSGSFDNSGQRQDTAAGLDRYVAQQQAPQNPMVFGNGMSQTFSEAASKQRPETAAGLDAFLQQMFAPRQQTYAAQEAAPPPNLFGMNGDDRGGGSGQTIATVPTVRSGVGQPPATRTVQSVSVKPPAPDLFGMNGDPGIPARGTTVGTVPTRQAPSQLDPVGRMPAFSDMAMLFGNTPQAAGSVNNNKDQSRLEPSTKVIDRSNTPVAVGMGERRLPVEGENRTVALPRPRPSAQPSNTRVAVTHQQVANPEYQRLMQQISRGEAQMRGVSSTGRPMSRDAYTATQSSQASIEALRRALASTPRTVQQTTRQPLKVTVNGAGSYDGGSVSAPLPETFKGTHSGRSYVENQKYTMGGDTYTANANGSFTNDRTGRTQGTGTKYYDADSNTFKTR